MNLISIQSAPCLIHNLDIALIPKPWINTAIQEQGTAVLVLLEHKFSKMPDPGFGVGVALGGIVIIFALLLLSLFCLQT